MCQFQVPTSSLIAAVLNQYIYIQFNSSYVNAKYLNPA